jgi:hypothetical protein
MPRTDNAVVVKHKVDLTAQVDTKASLRREVRKSLAAEVSAVAYLDARRILGRIAAVLVGVVHVNPTKPADGLHPQSKVGDLLLTPILVPIAAFCFLRRLLRGPR